MQREVSWQSQSGQDCRMRLAMFVFPGGGTTPTEVRTAAYSWYEAKKKGGLFGLCELEDRQETRGLWQACEPG